MTTERAYATKGSGLETDALENAHYAVTAKARLLVEKLFSDIEAAETPEKGAGVPDFANGYLAAAYAAAAYAAGQEGTTRAAQNLAGYAAASDLFNAHDVLAAAVGGVIRDLENDDPRAGWEGVGAMQACCEALADALAAIARLNGRSEDRDFFLASAAEIAGDAAAEA